MSKAGPSTVQVPKLCLPYGWKVITSKTYPDRVYYFNTRTNVSAWEQPQLVTEKEYLESVPPEELATKKAAKKIDPLSSTSLSYNNRQVKSEKFQYSARTPTKSSGCRKEDSEFSPFSNTDTGSLEHSDEDVGFRPELTEFQKKILENEEEESKVEFENQNSMPATPQKIIKKEKSIEIPADQTEKSDTLHNVGKLEKKSLSVSDNESRLMLKERHKSKHHDRGKLTENNSYQEHQQTSDQRNETEVKKIKSLMSVKVPFKTSFLSFQKRKAVNKYRKILSASQEDLDCVDGNNTTSVSEKTLRKIHVKGVSDGSEKKLCLSVSENGNHIVADDLPLNDLRYKIKGSHNVPPQESTKTTAEEPVELPTPKKNQIQSWINSISDTEPIPANDFPASPVSKTSSKSDGSSVSSKDRRVVLSKDSAQVYFDSGYSSSSAVTLTNEVSFLRKGFDEEIEAMEVDEDINEEEDEMMIVDLQGVREEVAAFPDLALGKLTKQDMDINTKLPVDNAKRVMNLIIDTNILMQRLKFLQTTLETEIPDFGLPNIIIPWIVMQELDFIKDSKSMYTTNQFTKDKANRAVKYLFSCLRSRHPRVFGQTAADSQQKVNGLEIQCNDDRILQCCFRYQQKYPNSCVVLLTDDINLCNKAQINNIHAFTKQTLLEGLQNLNTDIGYQPRDPNIPSEYPSHCETPHPSESQTSCSPASNSQSQYHTSKLVDELVCAVKKEIMTGLGLVLEVEMKEAYGNIWQCVVYRKPPWSALDIMLSIQKHWMAVFGMILQRNKQYLVNEIVNVLKNPSCNLQLEEVKVLIQNCVDFMSECESRGSTFCSVLKDCKLNLHNLTLKCTPKPTATKSIKFQTPPKSLSPTPDEEINSVADEESMITIVQDRFQLIWCAINDCCINLPQSQDPVRLLALIIPLITDLRQNFCQCLSISPQKIHLHQNLVEAFTHCLNSFFIKLKSDSPKPISPIAVLKFFSKPDKREKLQIGLQQLDMFLRQFHEFMKM